MKKLFLRILTLMLFFTWAVALADTTSVLLIPLRTSNVATNMGMFDPFDGHFLGYFYTDSVNSDTRYNAIQGPDGNIYVATYSSVANQPIRVFDRFGNYLYTYADTSDGISFVKAIAFRGDHLFIPNSSSITGYVVMEFDGPHSRLPDFITGTEAMHEIHFLEDGRCLVNLQTSDGIRLYNADGTPSGDVISLPFDPQQIQSDPQSPGAFLNITYASSSQITDFDLDGTIHNTISISRGAGIYRLGNGNLLMSNRSTNPGGVFEITDAGDTVDVELAGMRAYWIELCVVNLCSYVPGDVNGSDSYNGLDITYGVNYLKGGDPPMYECECTPGNTWFVSGDVNGSCSYNGLDITYGVNYFKGGADPIPCSDCPPG